MKPLSRYASLNDYVELARSLGLEPARLIRDCGLDPAGFGTQDRWIPAEAVAELLERSAAESGREDFGLRLAQLRRFSNLGPLSLVIREEPDVRSALRLLARHEHMYNEALHTEIVEANGVATIRVHVEVGRPVPVRQAVDLTTGVLHSLLRGFVGPGWRAVQVCFRHPAPRDRGTYLKMFGPHVDFDQDFDGILTYSTDLDATNAMADPLLRTYTRQLLGALAPTREATVADRVRELVDVLLPTGRCTADQVARSLGVDRRTVHRRLAQEDTTFTAIVDATRAAHAERMVAGGRHTLTEVADLLGFSSISNFSRWFRLRYGVSPRQWRDRRH
ncbi:AraC family transcriptional regulator [Nocardia neocaledoniensis]|uniref:AraC family transcriptional regulator n=1 Tax=Nocardia neocaledoniensis TaxID=236511 RepID=UPI002458D1CE|nr:AraC family transcriptional regulator [Nocardia neocaledoniensis]